MAKELKIQMTLDASGVKSGAKEAERALDSVSEAAEEASDATRFAELEAKVSNLGKTLAADLTAPTKELQKELTKSQQLLANWVSAGFSDADTQGLREKIASIGAELENRTGISGIGEEAKVANKYFAQLAEEMRTLTAQKKELEEAGTTLGYEEYDKTLQKLNELRAMLKAYQADLYEERSQGSYESTIKALKAEMAALDAKGEGLGTAGYDELYQQLLITTAALKEYKKSLADTVAQENASADNMTAQLAQAQAELSSLASAGLGFGDEDYDAQYQEVVRLTAELKEYKKALEEGATATENQSSVLSRLATAGKAAGSAILRVAGNVGTLAKNAASSAFSSIVNRVRGIGSSAKSAADGGLNNMVRQIRNIGVVSLGLKLCTSLFGRLRSVVSNYVSENEELSNSVTQLKNGLGQALAPAINLVINAMSKLLPYLVGVADAVASLITNIFGVGWTSVSTGASSAADAVDDVADATDDATAAQEAYNRTVAGFDEITKLNDNSSSGSSGTGSTGATTSTIDGTEGIAGILPEWLANIASLIESSQWAELGTYLADCLGSAVDKIYDILTSETTYAKIDSAVNALTTTVNSFFKEMNLVDDETGDSIASKLGKAIGAAINLAAYTVDSVVTGIDWSQIGLTIANVINGAVEETDFSLVGETIANWFLVLPKTLYSAIVNTDWGAVTSGLSEMVISAVTNVTDWLSGLDMTAVADSISDAFAGIDWGGIASSIVELLATAIGKSLELLAALGEDIAEGLVNGIGGFFTDIGEWLDENILQPLISGIKSIFGIASPAKNEDLVSAGENIGLGLLNAIASAFTNIGTWVQDNILTPITDTLSGVGDFALDVGVSLANTASDVWETFKSGWNKLSGVAVTIANSLASGASSLWSNFKSGWNGLSSTAVSIANSLASSAGSLWSSFSSNWGSRAVSIANSLKSSASSLWSTFSSNWGTRTAKITNTLKNTASSLWSSFKSGWKNKTLGISLTYSTNVGSVKKAVYKALGLKGWPTIKFAAQGGIVDRATLFGNTVAGEAGQEAIVPLERNTQWADIVATQIANKLASSNGGSQTVTINTYVTLDGKVVGKASADYAISQARATGQLPWAAYT